MHAENKAVASGKWFRPPGGATVGEAAALAVRGRVERVAALMPPACGDLPDDPEAVHQLRVATRRADAALRVFGGVLPRGRRDRLRRRLGGLRRAANDARDLDVCLLRLAEQGDTPADLLAELRRRREQAQATLRRACRKLRCGADLVRDAKRLLKRPPPKRGLGLSRRPFDDWAPGRYARLAERFFDEAQTPSRDATLHRLRVRCKRLRYAIELLGSTLPAPVRDPAYRLLTGVQTKLGDLNDYATALRRTPAWVGDDSQRRKASSSLV